MEELIGPSRAKILLETRCAGGGDKILYSFAQAAITKHHKLGDLNNNKNFFPNSGGSKSRMKV